MKNIEFISYSGSYPCLCDGILHIKIDGIDHIFGGYGEDKETSHPKFWCSGGGISDYVEEIICHNPWELLDNLKEFKPEIRELLPKLLELFNENVPEGCCGGCI